MADAATATLGLTKPEVGASSDTWGAKTNANFDAIDALFGVGATLLVSKGGTNASTAAGARSNLGLGSTDAVQHGALTAASLNVSGAATLAGVGAATLNVSGASTFGGSTTANFGAFGVARWHSNTAPSPAQLDLEVGNGYAILKTVTNVPLLFGVNGAEVARLSGGGVGVTGSLTVSGNTTLGDAGADTVTLNGRVANAAAFSARHAAGTELDLGFRGAPRNVQNGAYTFALADAGGMVAHFAGGAGIAWTIPADATANFPLGTVILLVTTGGGTTDIVPATSVTLAWAGTTLTGTRRLTGNGLASIQKLDGGFWIISGAGLS